MKRGQVEEEEEEGIEGRKMRYDGKKREGRRRRKKEKGGGGEERVEVQCNRNRFQPQRLNNRQHTCTNRHP